MELKVPYFNLSKQEAEATFGAIVEILLKSRLAMPVESHQGFYDEDVNAYLAGVLLEYIDPQYQEAIRRCLADRDTDVFAYATRDDDTYRTYWVYKVNADDRLLDLGIFRPQRERYETILGQAKTYYGFAAGYNHRLYGRATAVSDILDKLAHSTERYLSILHQARRDYLHFVETVTEEELRAFRERLNHDATTSSLRAKQDEFLDAYSLWQRTASPEAMARLLALLTELRQLDPLFGGSMNFYSP